MVCSYLNLQHSSTLYMSDTIAAVKLMPQQANRNKAIQKEGFKTPDIIIFRPNQKYHGLFIELKIDTPFRRDGEIKASQDDHLKKQLETLNQLEKLGYKAVFAWDFDQCKQIIDDYMKLL